VGIDGDGGMMDTEMLFVCIREGIMSEMYVECCTT
jgi:hypothetical protein